MGKPFNSPALLMSLTEQTPIGEVIFNGLPAMKHLKVRNRVVGIRHLL